MQVTWRQCNSLKCRLHFKNLYYPVSLPEGVREKAGTLEIYPMLSERGESSILPRCRNGVRRRQKDIYQCPWWGGGETLKMCGIFENGT